MQPADTVPVREGERLDASAVARFLREHVPDWPDGPIVVEQFPVGHSNLSYLIRCGGHEAVLRRPPFGPVAPRAHDVQREYEVLRRLHPAFPLAPRPYAFCGDPSLIGAPFYLMERRRGLVLDRSFPPGFELSIDERRRVSESLVRTLVELHAVDWRTAGLGDLTKPEGYLERQVRGWIDRYERAKTDDVPEVAWLVPWLEEHLPPSPAPTVVHNDYKLNNVMLDPGNPARIVAVFDWEMATVGDPLSDLATTLAYWSEPDDAETIGTPASVTAQPGFYTRLEVAELYARLTARDLFALGFYLAFAYFKIAVICQQIYYRWKAGQTRDPRFAELGSLAQRLIRQAVATARRGRL